MYFPVIPTEEAYGKNLTVLKHKRPSGGISERSWSKRVAFLRKKLLRSEILRQAQDDKFVGGKRCMMNCPDGHESSDDLNRSREHELGLAALEGRIYSFLQLFFEKKSCAKELKKNKGIAHVAAYPNQVSLFARLFSLSKEEKSQRKRRGP